MREVTSIRYEPRNADGYLRYINDPALFFLGAPSTFRPKFQGRQLARIRDAARRFGRYMGVRHFPVGVLSLRREEMAILPDGIVYKLSATWTEEASKTAPPYSSEEY